MRDPGTYRFKRSPNGHRTVVRQSSDGPSRWRTNEPDINANNFIFGFASSIRLALFLRLSRSPLAY